MSTCISSHGEFSSHVFDDKDPFTCTLCHVFDEEQARDRLAELEARHGTVTELAKDVAAWIEGSSELRGLVDRTWPGGFRIVSAAGPQFVVRVEQVEP